MKITVERSEVEITIKIIDSLLSGVVACLKSECKVGDPYAYERGKFLIEQRHKISLALKKLTEA
jgi:hypothetical protein